MRGLPGSGKTTLARKLVAGGGIIHSTDEFFTVDGVYRFIPRLIPIFHEKNFLKFKNSIRARVENVVVDNCSHRISHFSHYIEFARIYGYEIHVVEMPKISAEEAARNSTHNVPLASIERMIQTWETYKP